MRCRSFRLPRSVRGVWALVLIGTAVATGKAAGHDPRALDARSDAGAEAPFLAENEAAMAKMMTAMDVRPTGDVDHDFVAMMIPHHQGAIDMAEAVLRHGRNEAVRRLAQEIIVTQRDEIAAMRLAVGEAPTAPTR